MEHCCIGLGTRNYMVNVKWAVKQLIEEIRACNDISAKSLNKLLWGSHLPKYCETIRTTNPGSTAICAWNSVDHVDRPLAFTTIFIASKGAIEGLFGGCRSFVGIDGTFLKGNYGGVLLSLFPFARAIISSEDSENWRFVIWHLKNVLKDSDRGDEWCIISDRHHGIENALSELWPSVGRRYCCKHLCGSWKKVFPGPLMFSLFWKSCGAYSKFTFAKAMEQLQKTNPKALIWCDVNRTNFVESFNTTLGIERCRPVMSLLETCVRRLTMVRMTTRRQACEEWERDDLCPNIINRVKTLCY
ncbi:Leishmanolysin-like peptidase 2 [Bienertia sinuspersici]